jgi:hypothetical protein
MIPVILECEKYVEHVFKKINRKFSQPHSNFFCSDLGIFCWLRLFTPEEAYFFSNQCKDSTGKCFGNLW